MPASRTIFDDTPYFRSHQKAPRGRGSWAFADINAPRDAAHAVFFYGTFTQARAQARKHFPAGSIVVVLP